RGALRSARLPHDSRGGRGAARDQQHRRATRRVAVHSRTEIMTSSRPSTAHNRQLVLCLLLLSCAGRAYGDCVDPVEKAKLIAEKRGRRADERDFVKSTRHELTVQGGYYVSDLLDGTFIVGAAYTYHLTEDAGIEASFGYSQVRSSVAARLERDKGVSVLPKEDRVYLVFTDLIWSPIHGKMRVF